jgi:hypothetical protein
MQMQPNALIAAGALILTGCLVVDPAQAAPKAFHYRAASDTDWTTITEPAERCYDLQSDASLAHNKTNYKSLLYTTYSCNEDHLHQALIPNERWDGGLTTVKSVRFEPS